MKKNIYLLIILLSLVGCKDFLEETSQDLVRPSQVTDLEQILLGDGYGSPYYSTTIFTDEQQVRIWMMNLFNPLMMS
ncbi:MAG: hypothetical protein ACLU4N_19105 [Butyricimonas faecihominis]